MSKPTLYITLLLFTVFLFTGCSKEKSIGSLTIIDSLDTSENIENSLSHCTSLKVYNDKLFILDGSKINVYDVTDGAFKRTFGKSGKGPGEFNYANDFCICRDTVYVADSGNFRVQTYNIAGDYLSSYKYKMPWKINCFEHSLYVLPPTRHPGTFVSSYRNNSFSTEFDLDPILKENNIDKTEVDFLIFNDAKMFVLPFENGKFFFIDEDNKMTRCNFSNLLEEKQLIRIVDYVINDSYLYIVASTFTEKEGEENLDTTTEIKEFFNINEYLLKINSKFEIETQYSIPQNVLVNEQSLAIKDNFVFIYDAMSGLVYKLKMEN